ncbi:TPA: hypothetical protein QDB04_002239 [Burkholderia vietnamiensis]|nr:hypothetical protein [Burkholderia vietnamiensis]
MLPTEAQRNALLDLADWPRNWAREESDKAIGVAIVLLLKPFLQQLIDQGLAINTLRRHKMQLCILGSRVLDRMTQFETVAPEKASEVLDSQLCQFGGPLLFDATEAEERAFDATCKQLYRYRTTAASH